MQSLRIIAIRWKLISNQKCIKKGGDHHTLTDQENNVAFKSSKIQKIVESGAEIAFDIWYEYDKSIYAYNEIFSRILRYIKDNNIALLSTKSLAETACDNGITSEIPKTLYNKKTSN